MDMTTSGRMDMTTSGRMDMNDQQVTDRIRRGESGWSSKALDRAFALRLLRELAAARKLVAAARSLAATDLAAAAVLRPALTAYDATRTESGE